MTLTREKVAKAIVSSAGSFELCTELAWAGAVEDLMLVLAAIARGAAEWFDDDMRVELRPVGREACTVDVLVEIGRGQRERLFRSFVLNVGTDVAKQRCASIRDRLEPLFAMVDIDALAFSTVDPLRPSEPLVATQGFAERPHRETLVGLDREVVTLPFGLPRAHPNVPSFRGGDAPTTTVTTTLPFGPEKDGSSS